MLGSVFGLPSMFGSLMQMTEKRVESAQRIFRRYYQVNRIEKSLKHYLENCAQEEPDISEDHCKLTIQSGRTLSSFVDQELSNVRQTFSISRSSSIAPYCFPEDPL
jgi:hypothetical protein